MSEKEKGVIVQRKQSGLVKSILGLSIPAQFREADGTVVSREVKVKTYLEHLVRKLWPVLLQGGVRLAGSCASQVALSKRSRRISDIDITILVSDDVDFNQVFYHEQQILRQLAGMQDSDAEAQMLDTIRVSSETDCWSLFSFGLLEGTKRHLDVRVAKKMSRSFVFSCDSLEIVVDPLVVKGLHSQPMFIFSRWGSYAEALDDLRHRRLVMPEPAAVRHGLLRYSLALCRGFQVEDDAEREQVERTLVTAFLPEFKSTENVKKLISHTASRHSDSTSNQQLSDQVGTIIGSRITSLL